MIKKITFFFFIVKFLFAGSCYSILTETGLFTPVYPYNFKDNLNFLEPSCNYLQSKIIWDNNLSYVGCFKNFKEANYTLHHMRFNFRNPKIIKHKVTFKDKYVIFPKDTTVKKRDIEILINRYKPKIILKQFPKKIYGNGIDFVDIDKLNLMPTVNLYSFYRYYKKNNLSKKVLILYNGTYSIDYLCKKIKNKNIIEKINNSVYVLKYPIYISPSANLVIQNKTILLETKPKPIFIMYHGNLYAKNSKFITWDINKFTYAKREYIPEEELLLIGKQTPRPYFIGLSGSKTYFINNTFRGLGFHSTSATFGIAMSHFPTDLIINKFSIFTYLNNRGLPTGYYIGNTMYDNMMGFYCSNANKAVIIGNLMYDNLIYNIDPHDYSYHLIIARNITAKAKHAHGIVISRGVDYATIAQNITFNNHSAGIMLDRSSSHGFIYDNLSFMNGYMGISIQESDNNLIEDNKLIGNKIDGLIVRNSLRITAKNNFIAFNKKNGVEVITKDLSNLIYRDFKRDPYHLATSLNIKNNFIYKNMLYNITLKNNPAIYLKENKLKNLFYSNFGGELNIFTSKIIQNNGKFKLYGIGNPFMPISTDLLKMNKSTLKEALNVYIDSSCFNDFVSNEISKIYFDKLKNYKLAQMNYIRGISLLHPSDMYSYGFFLLSKVKNKHDYINAISYIAQSVIFGFNQGRISLAQMKYFINVNNNDINKAFKIAIDRLKTYKLVDDKYNVSCKIDNRKKAIIDSALRKFYFRYKITKSKNYYDYCNKALKNYTIFTSDVINKIKYIFKKANGPKYEYYKLLRRINNKINSNSNCKKVKLKLQTINSSLNNYYNQNKKEIKSLINEYLPDYLKKINQFRIQKVYIGTIKRLMEQK